MNLTTKPLILACLLMAGCCPDPQCPAFESLDGAQWMPPANSGNTTFESSATGRQVTFQLQAHNSTPAYKQDSHWAGEGCNKSDCKVEGSLSAVAAAPLGGQYPELYYRIQGDYDGDFLYGAELRYSIGDFSSGFTVGPQLKPYYLNAGERWEADSIAENYVIGKRVYEQVVIQTRKPDTTVLIQKVYLARGYGIVGFVAGGELFGLK